MASAWWRLAPIASAWAAVSPARARRLQWAISRSTVSKRCRNREASMGNRHVGAALTAIASLLLLGSASAQPGRMTAWAPQPAKPAPFTAPNALFKPLSAILARHKGQKDWSETEVLTRDYVGQYIQMAPGEKTKTQFYADDRVFWVVESGAIRFTIEGQEPFVATKGFLVQVPYRVPYSLETVGEEPSLRFEIRPSHEQPSYP